MRIWMAIGAIALLAGLVWLKHKFDPHSDAFRTKDREGWHIKKAKFISLEEYRRKRKIGEG